MKEKIQYDEKLVRRSIYGKYLAVKFVSQRTIKRWQKLREDGRSCEFIGRRFGVSGSRVYQLLKEDKNRMKKISMSVLVAVVICGCGKEPVVNVTVPDQPPATVEVTVPEQPAPQVVVPPPVYAKVENLNCSVETFGWKKFDANNCPDKHWVMTGHADNGIECAQQRVKCFVEGGE